MNRALPLFAIMAGLGIPACTTVTVRPAGPDSTVPGIRYSLPKPVLHVTPGLDGSVAVDVLFLPDPDATYAIDSHTALAAHSLDIMVSRGLLQKVGAAQDDTAVAADLVRASGAVAADTLKQEAAAVKAKEDAVASARAALDKAESELAAAEARLAAMEAAGITVYPESDIARQKVAVAEARAQRDQAWILLDRERAREPVVVPTAGSFKATPQGAGVSVEKLTPGSGSGAAATILDKTIGGAGRTEVYGGVLLAVEEGVIGKGDHQRAMVRLRPVNFIRSGSTLETSTQLKFETTAIPRKVPEPDRTGVITVALDKNGVGGFELTADPPILRLADPPYTLVPAAPVSPAVELKAGGRILRIDVSRMPPGDYKLKIPFKFRSDNGHVGSHTWEVIFRVIATT